jgi:DNA invertase Pin-like site-specific DNA recombinase
MSTSLLPQNKSKGRFYGYLRVSTPRQGEGVSLLTQREGIERFAAKHHLLIIGWFEEKKTAAKRGRPIFREVLKLLRQGKADGLIVHKVDRSARNLKDWADLGELIDSGIPVYFAGEDINMNTRSGRLAADIEAVIAADYIRNLREEAKRGIRKRLEQGLYPNYAPVGYLDQGAGKPKVIDPERGPFVKLAFEWYATGQYPLRRLEQFLYDLGLRNRAGGKVTINGLSTLLRNPFYMGYIHLKNQDKLYPGVHEPIVSKELFFKVQQRLKSKVWPRELKHRFKYSRRLKCATCGGSLVGSQVKGHVYYRCATKTCPTTCVREEAITSYLAERGGEIQSCGDALATVSGRAITLLEQSQVESPRSPDACSSAYTPNM